MPSIPENPTRYTVMLLGSHGRNSSAAVQMARWMSEPVHCEDSHREVLHPTCKRRSC